MRETSAVKQDGASHDDPEADTRSLMSWLRLHRRTFYRRGYVGLAPFSRFPWNYPVRGRTGESVYKRSQHFRSRPGGRGAGALPPGQPSFGLTPPAIGVPSGPARFLTPLPGPRAESGATRHLSVS
jgi:hypothetical protein